MMSAVATNAGMILGTAAYMSPEQARGENTDGRSDIFSFGCVLFEMLTGRQAFQGKTVSDILASVLARSPAGPDFSAQAITNPNGFAGLDGIFRLRSDGPVQRGLAVLEVHRGGPTVIDPAPQTFEHLGY